LLKPDIQALLHHYPGLIRLLLADPHAGIRLVNFRVSGIKRQSLVQVGTAALLSVLLVATQRTHKIFQVVFVN